jgi:hypothetical protein
VEELRANSSLRSEEDPNFDRIESRVSAVAWRILIAVFAGCALGLFGDGFLSRTAAEAPSGGLRVEYEWIGRFSGSLPLKIYAASDPDGLIRVSVDRTIIDAFHVRQIVPAPQSARLGPTGVDYAFAGGAAGSGPIVFDLEAGRPGTVRGSIRGGGTALTLRQFILP